jgi:hypothetical protein
MTDIHILGGHHLMDPEETIEKLNELSLSKNSIYFSEAKRERITNPESLPIMENYIRTVRDWLFSKGISVIPMGHEDFVSYMRGLSVGEVHAAQPPEDEYMVHKVIIPNLGGHDTAVIDVGRGHMGRISSELSESGLENRCHKLVCDNPILQVINYNRDYAENKNDVLLSGKIYEDYYTELAKIMGRPDVTPEVMDRLSVTDKMFVKEMESAIRKLDFKKFDINEYERSPSHIEGSMIRHAYWASKERLDKITDATPHLAIGPTLQSNI